MFTKAIDNHVFSVILNDPMIYYVDEDEEESRYWTLTFKVKGPVLTMEHHITEPCTVSLIDYSELLGTKNKRINFYQGNGEGSIVSQNDTYTFRSMPSGAGGDTITEVSCKAEHFKDLLTQAITEAQKRGYLFAK